MPKRKRIPVEPSESSELRIIGGKFRGSKLRYSVFTSGDDPVTRPMKHRVREAMFNLISTESKGRHTIDLFAGTGALGLEAISRGATSTTFIEKHIPTSRIVAENITALGLEDCCQLLTTSAFLWAKRDLPNVKYGVRSAELKHDHSEFRIPNSKLPWLVFCSPPYDFYIEQQKEMLTLIQAVIDHAPLESIVLVEADERFDFHLLPGGVAKGRHSKGWDVRTYPPAVVGVWRD